MTTITLSAKEKAQLTKENAIIMAPGDRKPLLDVLKGQQVVCCGELDEQPVPWDADPEWFDPEETTLLLRLSNGKRIVIETEPVGCDCCINTLSALEQIMEDPCLDPVDDARGCHWKVLSRGKIVILGYNDFPDDLGLMMWII